MAIPAALPRPGVHPWPMGAIRDPEVPERPTRRRFTAAYKVGHLEARLTRAENVIAVRGNVSVLLRELSLEGAEPKPGR